MAGGRSWLALLLSVCVMAAAGSSVIQKRHVVIHPEKRHGHSYLLCSLTSYNGGDLLRFSWVRLSANSTSHTLTAVTRDAFHRARLGKQVNIGDQVYCEVGPESLGRRPPAPPLRSAPVHLGVTWSSRRRPGGGVNLTLATSVAVSCGCRPHCRLRLRIWPERARGNDTQPELLLDKCVVSLNCPRGICWPATVSAAINNQDTEAPVTAHLRMEVMNAGDIGSEWLGYRPPLAAITVRPSTPHVCQLVVGSHIVGFDGRQRPLRRGGKHVLLASRASRRTIVISTLAVPCGTSPPAGPFCGCSVSVRVDSEWVTLDVCPRPRDRQAPRLQRSPPAARRRHRLHVLETRPASAWLITSGSDLVVRLHAFSVSHREDSAAPVSGRHEALSVTASVGPYRGTENGLCSGRGADDDTRTQHSPRKKRELPSQDHLVELPFDDLSDHLFSGALEPETPPETPPETLPETPPETPQEASPEVISETLAESLPKSQDKMSGEMPPVPETLPTVAPYFKPDVQSDAVPEEIKSASVPYNSDRIFSGSGTASGHKSASLHTVMRRRRVCEDAITAAQQSSACTVVISLTVLSALSDICQSETGRLVAGERWSELLPPLLEDRCQVAALSQTPPVKGTLRCTDGCLSGRCDTQHGIGNRHDRRPTSSAPLVVSVGQQGLCDLATASCGSVTVRARHFWPSVGLRCRVQQNGGRRWRVALATYRSEVEIQCHLPTASLKALQHSAEVVPWTIQVSYNGVSWSDPLVLNTFNSDCQLCQSRADGVSCADVVDSCIIEGQCFRSGDTNPRNPCRYCGSNRHQWVTRIDESCVRGQPVTCQTVGPVCQHGLCVEDSGGAICVCHPGYIGTHCQIRERLPDVVTIEEEMGDEALYGRHTAHDGTRLNRR